MAVDIERWCNDSTVTMRVTGTGLIPVRSTTWRISLKVKHYEVQHTGSTPEI